MDLRIQDQTATAVERQAVDAVLGPPESSWDGAARNETDGLRLRRADGAARKDEIHGKRFADRTRHPL